MNELPVLKKEDIYKVAVEGLGVGSKRKQGTGQRMQ